MEVIVALTLSSAIAQGGAVNHLAVTAKSGKIILAMKGIGTHYWVQNGDTARRRAANGWPGESRRSSMLRMIAWRFLSPTEA
jgi:hypothetical protein